MRRFLAGTAHGPDPAMPAVFREQTRRFALTQTLVRVFYAFLLYFAVSRLGELSLMGVQPTFTPLWPVAWLESLPGPSSGARALLAFYLVTSVAGFFLAPWRAGRIATFLGLLEYVALKNSYGKIGHSLHLVVLMAGVLILLPAGWSRPAALTTRRLRQETLLVFWLAQAALLMSYTMGGVGKLGGALWQAVHFQTNAFSPGALGAHVAQRLLQTHSTSTLGAWIIRHPFLTWPAMPAATLLETVALLVAFRPALGRPVAGLLIVFHIGTYYTMTISFPQSCFLLAIFFFPSPFEPATLSRQTVLGAIPLFGRVGKIWQSTRKRVVEVAKR